MFDTFDDKGKIFTHIITKIPVEVIIQTEIHSIRGKIHIRKDNRLKDELNSNEAFIALTDVVITNQQGEIVREAGFLAVHRSHIIWVLPLSPEPTEENEE